MELSRGIGGKVAAFVAAGFPGRNGVVGATRGREGNAHGKHQTTNAKRSTPNEDRAPSERIPTFGVRSLKFGVFFRPLSSVDSPAPEPTLYPSRFTLMKTPRLLARVAALFLTLGASPGHAQVTMYARFANGNAPWAGASIDVGRSGWTNLTSVSFGTSVAVNFGGGSPTVGPPAFDSVVLTKAVDRLTPQIFATLAPGTPIDGGLGVADVTLEFVTQTVAGPVTYFRVELRRAYLVEQKTAVAVGGNTVEETVALKNVAFRYTHWPILANGTQGTAVVRSWSSVSNTPTFTP